jgi:hypothetical protein
MSSILKKIRIGKRISYLSLFAFIFLFIPLYGFEFVYATQVDEALCCLKTMSLRLSLLLPKKNLPYLNIF